MSAQTIQREQISAMADNSWDGGSSQDSLRLLATGESKDAWRLYHQIGDVLRSPEYAAYLDDGFDRRFRARFAAEPVFLPVQPRRQVEEMQAPVSIHANRRGPSRLASAFSRHFGVAFVALAAVSAASFFSVMTIGTASEPRSAQLENDGGTPVVVNSSSKPAPLLLEIPASSATSTPAAMDKSTSGLQTGKPLARGEAADSLLTPVVHASASASRNRMSGENK